MPVFSPAFRGPMMFLAGISFFFHKLAGRTKEDVHNAVIEQRRQFESGETQRNNPDV